MQINQAASRPTAIIVADTNWALCRGYSAILGDAGLCEAIRVNSITGCIQHIETWSDSADGLAIIGPNLEPSQVFDFFRWLRRNRPNVKSILISRQATDPIFYIDVAANHVQACLSHEARCEDIAETIANVLSGQTLFSTDVLESAFQPIQISPREQDVLRLMLEEMTYKQIAHVLQLSDRTVNNHAQRIFVKLQVHDRNSAIARADRRGLL
jgi:DNA-binding NarL/FixJ family response regulator